tara:strand:+ start:11366 stop:12559 length:1194 start_codon:yes stop_codon:yes gene_type:complete
MTTLIKKLLQEVYLDKEVEIKDTQPYPYTDELTEVFNNLGYQVDHIYPYDNISEEIPGSIAYDVYVILDQNEAPVPIYLYINPDGYVYLQDYDKEIMLGPIDDVGKIVKTLSYELGPPAGESLTEAGGMPIPAGNNSDLPPKLESFRKFLTVIKLYYGGSWGATPQTIVIYLTPNNKIAHIKTSSSVRNFPFKIGDNTSHQELLNFAEKEKFTIETIKRGLREGTFSDVTKDLLGDLAMGAVGSIDGADALILIPAILKNLRELKVAMDNIDVLVPKFNEDPEKFKEPLRDEADSIIMDVVDVMQRIIELLPGSIVGSITSFVGGQISMAYISNTLIKTLGEKFAKLNNSIPDALKYKLSDASNQIGMVGFGEIPEALDKAGFALNLVESYEEYTQQ